MYIVIFFFSYQFKFKSLFYFYRLQKENVFLIKDWILDKEELELIFNEKIRVIVINIFYNFVGKVKI